MEHGKATMMEKLLTINRSVLWTIVMVLVLKLVTSEGSFTASLIPLNFMANESFLLE